MVDYLRVCRDAARAGGESVSNSDPGATGPKDDKCDGDRSFVTEGDYKAQKAVLEVIARYDNKSLLVTEEAVQDERLGGRCIQSGNHGDLSKVGAYIIDELCGSSGFAVGHYEWAVSVGFVKNLEHRAGAVYAPMIEGGILFSASKGNDAFMTVGSGEMQEIRVGNNRLEDAYVLFGVDSVLTQYPRHNSLLTKVGDRARTISINGSCVLSMGLVASGKADALVQPPQRVWDWAAGKVIVEEADGKVLFYGIDDGRIEPVDKLEAMHYDFDKRAVGFVAGNEILAGDIMKMLLEI